MASSIKKIVEVFYPYDEAVEKAVEQNMAVHKRMGLSRYLVVVDPVAHKEAYKDEVVELFKIDGKNQLPQYPDFERICVDPLHPKSLKKEVK